MGVKPSYGTVSFWRLPQADSEGLGLVRPGNDATVVVRKHDNGTPHEVGTKYAFARDIEVIAIAKSEHPGVI